MSFKSFSTSQDAPSKAEPDDKSKEAQAAAKSSAEAAKTASQAEKS
jgi:hypothetical protein